jgi:hypothetical protein
MYAFIMHPKEKKKKKEVKYGDLQWKLLQATKIIHNSTEK